MALPGGDLRPLGWRPPDGALRGRQADRYRDDQCGGPGLYRILAGRWRQPERLEPRLLAQQQPGNDGAEQLLLRRDDRCRRGISVRSVGREDRCTLRGRRARSLAKVTRFRDVRDYVAIPRLNALRLSPDGGWLAAVVQTRSRDGKKFVSSIWRIDPGGSAPAGLTRSAAGETSPEFLPDGSLLFISGRPDPAGPPDPGQDTGLDGSRVAGDKAPVAIAGPSIPEDDDGDEKSALWLMPAAGGEPYRVASAPGGIAAVTTARAARSVILAVPTLPGSAGAEQDASRREARKRAAVTAILHESGPVRYWDHDLGPDQLSLMGAKIGAGDELHDLTPEAGRALDEQAFELTPDGTRVVTGWSAWDERGERTDRIVVIDMITGRQRALLSEPGYDFSAPRISPDGRLVAGVRDTHDSYDKPGGVTLVVTALDGTSEPIDLFAGFDRRPAAVAWAPDSGAVYFTADDRGRRPVFRADLATGQVVRLTADDGRSEERR